MALRFFGNGPGGSGEDSQPPGAGCAAMIAEVRGYWQALRRDGALPLRAEIDPRGIAGALSGAFLVERIAPGVGRLRIAGSSFTELLGMDARGMPLSAVFDPVARNRLAVALDQCFLRPAILDAPLAAETGLGRPALTGRMILLPLASDGTRAETALGCLALSGTVGRQPRRLITGALSPEPVDPGTPDLRAPALRMLEAAGPQFSVRPTRSGTSYLQLVDLDETSAPHRV
jgi:hypothetical protein